MRERHHHHHHHHHYSDRDSYAYKAGDIGPGPNRHRLYRDINNKLFSGVCSGIANYYGWRSPVAIRIVWAIASVMFFPFPVIAYVIAAYAIKPGPVAPVYQSPEEERFWRTFSTRPRATFSELKHRFRALDARIADMERTVTSDEYGLRKAFTDLERGA